MNNWTSSRKYCKTHTISEKTQTHIFSIVCTRDYSLWRTTILVLHSVWGKLGQEGGRWDFRFAELARQVLVLFFRFSLLKTIFFRFGVLHSLQVFSNLVFSFRFLSTIIAVFRIFLRAMHFTVFLVFPRKLHPRRSTYRENRWGCATASQNSYPYLWPNLLYSLLYLWHDQRFETLFCIKILFQAFVIIESLV